MKGFLPYLSDNTPDTNKTINLPNPSAEITYDTPALLVFNCSIKKSIF